jgi:hypothetical protein
MLLEISSKSFFNHFPNEQHPFLKQQFIDLNSHKVERVVYLIQDTNKPSVGLIAGIRDGSLLSPFSAPFGGFHYRHENIYISEIERFVDDLKDYLLRSNIHQFYITFPPSIYGISFNSKMINMLLRKQFLIDVPDLTNWVNLCGFEDKFKQRNSREYYNQALRNKLSFKGLDSYNGKKSAYELIRENRKSHSRPIHMTFEDLTNTAYLWPVDFYGVYDTTDSIVASGIFYQFPNGNVFAAFWGDNESGRQLRAMDFLSFNLWSHYKNKGFSYIDLGISTESGGIPNEGLLRFKETHESVTELRYKLSWSRQNC